MGSDRRTESSNGVIHGCVSRGGHVLSVVAPGRRCGRGAIARPHPQTRLDPDGIPVTTFNTAGSVAANAFDLIVTCPVS